MSPSIPQELTIFTCRAKLWIYPGEAAWYFVSIPKQIGKTISNRFEEYKRGFGSLKVEVTVGTTSWKTSLFPDKSTGSYVLPIKAQVRKKEDLQEGQNVSLSLRIVT